MLVAGIYVFAVLTLWALVVIADRSAARLGHPYRWRTLLWLIPLAAVGPSLLWASPFGPARDLASAARWLVYGYPAWFLLSVIWLLPGIALSKRFALKPLWVLPLTAVLVQLVIGGVAHWPPTRWWPLFIAGQMPVPSAYVLRVPVEAWYGYLFSLWPKTFMALATAVSFLIALQFVRPNNRWSRP